MGKALDAALAHLKALGTRHLDVPEWQVPDGNGATKPLRIYYQPLTMQEREQILSGDSTDLTIMIAKARDENGEPLFTLEDEPKLKRAASWHVINRIATTIFSLPALDIETARKN